jgi:hypothetical protein
MVGAGIENPVDLGLARRLPDVDRGTDIGIEQNVPIRFTRISCEMNHGPDGAVGEQTADEGRIGEIAHEDLVLSIARPGIDDVRYLEAEGPLEMSLERRILRQA